MGTRKSFWKLNTWTHLVACLCLLGALVNMCSIVNDLRYSSVLLRLHLGFLVLYISQVVFILLKEKWVVLLTVLQGIMALCTNSDFIFVPILRVFGKLYLSIFTVSIEGLEIYKYIFVSLATTLQMYTAYALFCTLRNSSKAQNVTTSVE